MTFIDFCAGIGGGRLGLELNGLQCIGYSEIDKEAVKTYKKLHDAENEINFGDITKINPALLPDFDLLIAGFPCQTLFTDNIACKFCSIYFYTDRFLVAKIFMQYVFYLIPEN